MSTSGRSQTQLSVIFTVVLTLLIVIAPQWLLTRDLTDGAVISFARTIGNTDGLFLWFSNSNWFLAIAFYKVIFALADFTNFDYLIFVKCAISLLLVGIYRECCLLAKDVFNLPAKHAPLAALLCIASPCLYILANSLATVNLLCLWLVMFGHRLYWSEKAFLRIIALVLLVLSFQVNSNLVFVLALDIVRIWRYKNTRKERLAWLLALFFVVILTYVSMRTIFPPKQNFAAYNQLLNPFNLEDLRRIIRSIAMFLTWGILPLSAMFAVFVASLCMRNRKKCLLPKEIETLQTTKLILALCFLAGAAAFPYIAVGKGPPLFTLTAYGNGLTEQVLRAAYAGPLAPTWANTAARHGFLLTIPMGLLTWVAGAELARKLSLRLTPIRLYALLLPLSLAWVLPAYGNKLQNQWAEMSLVKGFRALPSATAGIVDLKYQPISSWLIWSSSANLILREAWGRSGHMGFFYSTDAYRDDMYWQYQSHILDMDVLGSRVLQNILAMDSFPGADCYSKYQGVWPTPTALQLIFGGWFSEMVSAASIQQLESDCVAGRVLPNPYPDKKVIY
jgi:hypothetical protein